MLKKKKKSRNREITNKKKRGIFTFIVNSQQELNNRKTDFLFLRPIFLFIDCYVSRDQEQATVSCVISFPFLSFSFFFFARITQNNTLRECEYMSALLQHKRFHFLFLFFFSARKIFLFSSRSFNN